MFNLGKKQPNVARKCDRQRGETRSVNVSMVGTGHRRYETVLTRVEVRALCIKLNKIVQFPYMRHVN